jgi:hypothetical protein
MATPLLPWVQKRVQTVPPPESIADSGLSVPALDQTLPGVAIHPAAPEVTEPLNARAVTVGQNIYFHPGQFQPDTAAGQKLLRHELAHTLQTRHSPGAVRRGAGTISRPGDVWERNAEALASGQTSRVEAAPAGAQLRTPFPGESAADAARRASLTQSIQRAETRLIELLRSGGLLQGIEAAAVESGVRGVSLNAGTGANGDFLSYAARDTLVRRIIRNLVQMAFYYREHPIPPALPPAEFHRGEAPDEPDAHATTIAVTGGSSTYVGRTPEWSQLQAAYELYRISAGQTGTGFENDWLYLRPDSVIVPGAAHGARRASRGVPSGAYVVFPNLDSDPTRYIRVDGFTSFPPGASPVIELWHDDFGYYYFNDGQRVDVESPWSSDHPRGR